MSFSRVHSSDGFITSMVRYRATISARRMNRESQVPSIHDVKPHLAEFGKDPLIRHVLHQRCGKEARRPEIHAAEALHGMVIAEARDRIVCGFQRLFPLYGSLFEFVGCPPGCHPFESPSPPFHFEPPEGFCLCRVLLCIRAEEVVIPVDLNHTALVCPTRTRRTIAHFPFGPRGSMVSGRQMYIVGIEPDSVPAV